MRIRLVKSTNLPGGGQRKTFRCSYTDAVFEAVRSPGMQTEFYALVGVSGNKLQWQHVSACDVPLDFVLAVEKK